MNEATEFLKLEEERVMEPQTESRALRQTNWLIHDTIHTEQLCHRPKAQNRPNPLRLQLPQGRIRLRSSGCESSLPALGAQTPNVVFPFIAARLVQQLSEGAIRQVNPLFDRLNTEMPHLQSYT